jgi:hypothetical protein
MMQITSKMLGISLWTTPVESNPLKIYMAWLKKSGGRSFFSHADFQTTLHQELSVLDNLLLAIGDGSIEGNILEKENHLSWKLESEGLKALASWFKNPHRRARDLSEQEAFVASVCHALLRPVEKVLIDMNQVKLDPMCANQLQKILKDKSNVKHITVRVLDKTQWSEGFDEEFNHQPSKTHAA